MYSSISQAVSSTGNFDKLSHDDNSDNYDDDDSPSIDGVYDLQAGHEFRVTNFINAHLSTSAS